MSDDQVGAFAAQASFFILLSFFPIVLLILNIIRFTPVSQSVLLTAAVDIFPDALDPLIISIIEEMYSMSSGTIISISAIISIWTASKGILALIRGLNMIYHIKEKRNYLVLRFISSIYTLIFVVGIALSLVLLVFGNSLVKNLSDTIPTLRAIVYTLTNFKFLHMPFILMVVFIGLYRLVPNKKYKIKDLFPGAMFSTVGWIAFSSAFSLYVDHFAGASYIYGSLTTVILLMLWIYIDIYIIFIGAEINLYFKTYFDRARELRDAKLQKVIQKKK